MDYASSKCKRCSHDAGRKNGFQIQLEKFLKTPHGSMYYIALIQIFIFSLLSLTESANWAQLAGKKTQTVVEPYDPDDGLSPARPMWSPRWGHSTVVLNHTSMYRDVTTEENSNRSINLIPKLFLFGGDDYLGDNDKISNGGFRNDVWYAELSSRPATTWFVRYPSLSLDKNQKGLPKSGIVSSNMMWRCVNEGLESPTFWPEGHTKVGKLITHDEWISCQDYFGEGRGKECFDEHSVEYSFKMENMWSPRRGHASVVFNGDLYVIGGRTRERVMNPGRQTIRENTVLKNDIWMSKDAGKTWKLVTPGCRNQQEDILVGTEYMSGNTRYLTKSNGLGNISPTKCRDSTDCYGDEVCKAVDGHRNQTVCVCPMFGIREHHSLSVQHRYVKRDDGVKHREDYLYVSGGFTQVRHDSCGNRACGSRGSYRMALDDVWASNDAINWVQLRQAAVGNSTSFKPRGGHSTNLISKSLFPEQDVDILFVFGGESVGPNNPKSEFLGDIWYMELYTQPCCAIHKSCHLRSHPLTHSDVHTCISRGSEWIRLGLKSEIDGRAGHVSIHEPASSLNGFRDYIYIIGGKNSTAVHSDVWSLDLTSGESWELDTSAHTWKSGVEIVGDDGLDSLRINSGRKFTFYYDLESSLTSLVSLRLPSTKTMDINIFAAPLVFNVIENRDIAIIDHLGIRTFSDLIHADQQTILQLRGYDIPGKERVPHVKNICYVKELLEKFNNKCLLGEISSTHQDIFHLCQDSTDHDGCVASAWDGCHPIHGYTQIVIPYISGAVSVPVLEQNHDDDLQNMHCKYTPGPRYMASGQYIDGKVLIIGGQGNNPNKLYRDVWYRDDSYPTTVMRERPKSKSSSAKFLFESNEDGALHFEYKIFDLIERLEVTRWITCFKDELVDLSWLDSKKGGPGTGWYTLYVRSVDPSGNREEYFSTTTNTYTWFYREPLPWRKIIGVSFSTIFMILVITFEVQRRKRKAVLERYHLRRLKRKFKLNNGFDEIHPQEPPFHGHDMNQRGAFNIMSSEVNNRKAFFFVEKEDEKFSWTVGNRDNVQFQRAHKHKSI